MSEPLPPYRLDSGIDLLLAPRGLGEPAVLATIVATAGSTYRKAGARMLLYADRSHVGLLSGGCLEGDLAEHAADVLARGRARAVEYDLRGPDDALFGIGAGCEGAMRVLLEPASPGTPAAAALEHARECARRGTPVTLVAVHDSDGLALGTRDPRLPLTPELAALAARAEAERRAQVLDTRAPGTGGLRAYADWVAPPPRVLVCGGGDDAIPLVAGLVALGWTVIVTDHRPRYASAQRFAGARVICADAEQLAATVDLGSCHAALVMSHHLTADGHYLAALSTAASPRYVGLLGPRARRERLLAGAAGGAPLADGLRGRLRGPVGLDLGARSPEAIALSIVAELHAWLAGARATFAPALE